MKLLSILIILITLFLVGLNWAGFWHNLMVGDSQYNANACRAVGYQPDCFTKLEK
jgi:FtsZ-interacting cell division protein ZipA